MKLPDDVAVEVPTETVIGPVVAPDGTVTVKLFVVAEVTVAGVPLNCTVLLLAVLLKFCPWMVTVVPTLPCAGVKFKMARAVADGRLEREMERMLPTAS